MNEEPQKPTLPRFPKRRIVMFVIVVLVAGSAFAVYLGYALRPRAFVQRWSERLRTVDSLDMARRLEQAEPVIVHTLPSGEWFIATCEHSCCTGAGFNATVIRDSTGAIYADTTYSFCGIEGMSSDLANVSGETLSTFYPNLKQLKLQKQ